MPWISKNRIGIKYGKWTIKERDLTKMRPIKYICECQCGNIASIFYNNLSQGLSSQCRNCQSLQRSKDMVGNKYFHLTVISACKKDGKAQLECLCDCGNIRFFDAGKIGDKPSKYSTCGKCDLNKKNKPIAQIGVKKGMLTILDKYNEDRFVAQCDCGKKKIIKSHHMKTKNPSCGCYWKTMRENEAKKYIGFKWGRLKVIKFLGMKGKGTQTRANYLIRCKCGKELERQVGHMFSIFSCGCLQRENVPKGSQVHCSKTNETEVSAIRSLFKSGLYSRKQLSEMMEITYSSICRILKDLTSWKHVR